MTTEQEQQPINGMAELSKILEYDGAKIRIYSVNNEPWFCGNDIAELLGYKRPRDAINNHVDLDDKSTLELLYVVAVEHRYHEHANKNELNSIYINESGIYSLVLRSKLEIAKKFRKWITKTIIPAIRKNGYYVSDNILPEKVKQLENELKELEEKNKKIEEEKKSTEAEKKAMEEKLIKSENKNIKYSEYFKDTEKLQKTEVFYVATTEQYAKNNRFKYGGVENMNLLKSRLAGYNTGRAEGDNIYFAKIVMCNSYKQIENRLESLAKKFKDKKDGKKEMLNMRYDYLEKLINFITENNDKEIEFINENLVIIFEDTMNLSSIVPAVIDIGATTKKIEKIDISTWTKEQRNDVLIQLLNDLASDKNIKEFDYKTTHLKLDWSNVIQMIEEKYGKNKRTVWKNTISDLIKNTKIIIEGIRPIKK